MPNVEYEDDNKPSNNDRRAKVKGYIAKYEVPNKFEVPNFEYEDDNNPITTIMQKKKILYGDIYHDNASAE